MCLIKEVLFIAVCKDMHGNANPAATKQKLCFAFNKITYLSPKVIKNTILIFIS